MLGGYHNKQQISVVDECRLTKIGELPFRMSFGACAQRDNEKIFICFEDFGDSSTYKNCHVTNGPLENFSNLPNSTFGHGNTRIAVTSGKSQSRKNTKIIFLTRARAKAIIRCEDLCSGIAALLTIMKRN